MWRFRISRVVASPERSGEVFRWPDGREYRGDWKDGKQHDEGVFKTAKGDLRRGEWKDGVRIRWISEAYREDGDEKTAG